MTREEMLQKLSEIKLIVTNMVVTYDMGMQFDVITSEGFCTNFGNVGCWPALTYEVTDEIIQMRDALRKGEAVTDEQMMKNEIIKNICTYSYPVYDSYVLSGDSLEICLRMIREELPKLKLDGKYFYVFAVLESWSLEIKFYDTAEELADYFVENYRSDSEPLEYLDEDELESIYEIFEEHGPIWLPGCVCEGQEEEND